MTLQLILDALRDTGIIPPVGGSARRGPAETRFTQQRRQPEEEQAKEFLDIVGARGIKAWSFQEIGDAMGITRERAKWIVGRNPVLRALRSDSPQARVKEKLKVLLDLLQGGESLSKATRRVGLTCATLNRYLAEGARRLDDDPDTRRLLDHLVKLREALAIVRQRVQAGVPFADACEGLEPDPVVLRRHLARAARRNPPRREAGKQLASALVQAKRHLLRGASLSEASRLSAVDCRTIRKHLLCDTEVAPLLAKRRHRSPGGRPAGGIALNSRHE